MAQTEPFPVRDAIVKRTRRAADVFVRWNEQSLQQRVNGSPYRSEPSIQLNAGASTSGTLGGAEAAGLYRVSAYREVTVADPVSSSLALVIGWTHNAKALTRTLTAFTGAPQSINDSVGDVTTIEIDPGTSISYTLTYASNTPGLARFDVTMSAELLESME